MANSITAAVGTFVKKVLSPDGTVSENKVPFYPKTLARLVFTNNGESAEHVKQRHDKEIGAVEDRALKLESGETGIVSKETFNTVADYKKALEDGTADSKKIYVIKD